MINKRRELAEKQVEKERIRRINQMIEEQNSKLEKFRYTNVVNGKQEIKLALDEQLAQKRNKILEERRKQNLIINSCNKNVIGSQKN